jgi:hypothetical protein
VIGRGAVRIRRFKQIGVIALLAVGLGAPAVSQEVDSNAGSAADPTPPTESEAGTHPQVIVHPLLVRYTPEFLAHKRRRKHQIQGQDLERIRRHYREVVSAKLASTFSIASKPGPRVVRVDAVLLDHELDKRDWLVPTRIAFRGAPRIQLVAYLRDSQTGEILDRVGMTLRPDPNRLMKASPGFYWHYMRRVFDRIATRVRWALEDGAASS